jgi:hypothetical protein
MSIAWLLVGLGSLAVGLMLVIVWLLDERESLRKQLKLSERRLKNKDQVLASVRQMAFTGEKTL